VVRAALRLLLAAALGAAPSLARADVYRWVDDSGQTHFATSLDAVPRGYRDGVQVIPAAPATVQNPSSSHPPARSSPPPQAAQPAPAPAPAAAPVEPPPPSNGTPAPASGKPGEFGPETRAAPAPAPAPAVPAPTPEPPAAAAPVTAPEPAAMAPAIVAPAVTAPAAVTQPAVTAPAAAPAALPAPEAVPQAAAPANPPDPRQGEIAELEAQIERDREVLRKLVSMPRWDSSELASDPQVREISERLPRLQAELAALRSESEH